MIVHQKLLLVKQKKYQKILVMLIFFTKTAENVYMEDNNNCVDAHGFWKRVQVLCRQKGIYQKQLSEALGYGLRNLDLKIYRSSVPSTEELKRLSLYLGVSYDYLLDGRGVGTSPSFCVSFINEKATKSDSDPRKNDVRYISVPDGMRGYGDKVAALYISGDSMEPTLRRGDIVICDTCGYEGEGVYVIQMNGEGVVRRLYRDMGKYIIKTENPIYPQKIEPLESASIKVVGRVHYIIKRYD